MKMNEIYEAPAVEIVKVAVEAGFQISGDIPSTPGEFGGVSGGSGEEI